MKSSLLRRLYRRLLILLPADFRRRNASAMEEEFGEALKGSASSRVGRLGTLVTAAGDVVAFALLARWRRLTARRTRRAHHSHDHSRNKEPPVLKALARDAWFTIRSFRKAPAFAAVAILTIGLGIGATTLVFSVVYGVLLRPLPYDDSDRLVNVWNDLIEERQFLPAVHPADFRDYQQMSETFEEFAAASGAQAVGVQGVLTGEGPPQHVDASSVTHNFLSGPRRRSYPRAPLYRGRRSRQRAERGHLEPRALEHALRTRFEPGRQERAVGQPTLHRRRRVAGGLPPLAS